MLGQFLSPDLEETGSFHILFLETLTLGAPAAVFKGKGLRPKLSIYEEWPRIWGS